MKNSLALFFYAYPLITKNMGPFEGLSVGFGLLQFRSAPLKAAALETVQLPGFQDFKLAAVRWPEGEVMYDDGKCLELV